MLIDIKFAQLATKLKELAQEQNFQYIKEVFEVKDFNQWLWNWATLTPAEKMQLTEELRLHKSAFVGFESLRIHNDMHDSFVSQVVQSYQSVLTSCGRKWIEECGGKLLETEAFDFLLVKNDAGIICDRLNQHCRYYPETEIQELEIDKHLKNAFGVCQTLDKYSTEMSISEFVQVEINKFGCELYILFAEDINEWVVME